MTVNKTHLLYINNLTGDLATLSEIKKQTLFLNDLIESYKTKITEQCIVTVTTKVIGRKDGCPGLFKL